MYNVKGCPKYGMLVIRANGKLDKVDKIKNDD